MKFKLENFVNGYKIVYTIVILAVFVFFFYTISKKNEGFETNVRKPIPNSDEKKDDEKTKNSKIKSILDYAKNSLTLIRELNPSDFDNILKDTNTSDFEKLDNIHKVLYPKI